MRYAYYTTSTKMKNNHKRVSSSLLFWIYSVRAARFKTYATERARSRTGGALQEVTKQAETALRWHLWMADACLWAKTSLVQHTGICRRRGKTWLLSCLACYHVEHWQRLVWALGILLAPYAVQELSCANCAHKWTVKTLDANFSIGSRCCLFFIARSKLL